MTQCQDDKERHIQEVWYDALSRMTKRGDLIPATDCWYSCRSFQWYNSENPDNTIL